MTTSFERSAIIGFWRCGATFSEIAEIMQKSVEEISKIILDYIRNKRL